MTTRISGNTVTSNALRHKSEAFVLATAMTVVGRFLPSLLLELCAELDAQLYIEPKYGYAGFVEFDGRRRAYFRGTSFDLNPQGASTIVRDKDYCARALRTLGYKTPESCLLFSPGYRRRIHLRNEAIGTELAFAEPALDFAKTHGFPLFIKPNEGSEGRSVVKVDGIEAMFANLFALFEDDEKILLQAPAPGRDYRVVVLDGSILSAYERLPLAIQGDGQSTIHRLAEDRLSDLKRDKRGSKISLDDLRIPAELSRQHLTFDSIPENQRRVTLLPNANLSTGGEAEDVTSSVSPFYRDLACQVVSNFNLRLAGVDLLASDIRADQGDYSILEINSAPGLNNFAGSSLRAEQRTKDLYRKLLYAISRSTAAP